MGGTSSQPEVQKIPVRNNHIASTQRGRQHKSYNQQRPRTVNQNINRHKYNNSNIRTGYPNSQDGYMVQNPYVIDNNRQKSFSKQYSVSNAHQQYYNQHKNNSEQYNQQQFPLNQQQILHIQQQNYANNNVVQQQNYVNNNVVQQQMMRNQDNPIINDRFTIPSHKTINALQYPQNSTSVIKHENQGNINSFNIEDRIKEFNHNEQLERKQFEDKQRKIKEEFERNQMRRREYLNNEINKFEKSFDPLKILNLTLDSTLDDVKKSYKKLAVKYHPDKNRGKSSNKFKLITQAYCYILRKFEENKREQEKTSQDVVYQEYNDDINEPVENIYLDKDNFNINKFNKIFEKYKIPNSNQGGYGNMMEKSDRLLEGNNYNKNDIVFGNKFNIEVFNANFNNNKKSNNTQITVYNEPQALDCNNMGFSELGSGTISDYSGQSQNYTDYKRAHQTETLLIDPSIVDYKQYKNVNELKSSRSNINYQMSHDEKMRQMQQENINHENENQRLTRVVDRDNQIANQYKKLNRLMVRNR